MYGLVCVGFSPKAIKVPKDTSLEEVSKIFQPIINKNGYNYMFPEDPKCIEEIELLWMIVHQKPYLPTSRLIYLGMTRGLACEKILR
jgi:hypothetical protein